MPTFGTKKLLTGANGQKEHAASLKFICAVLIELAADPGLRLGFQLDREA